MSQTAALWDRAWLVVGPWGHMIRDSLTQHHEASSGVAAKAIGSAKDILFDRSAWDSAHARALSHCFWVHWL